MGARADERGAVDGYYMKRTFERGIDVVLVVHRRHKRAVGGGRSWERSYDFLGARNGIGFKRFRPSDKCLHSR